MLEIEMKFPVSDFGPIRSKLAAWQARPEPVRHDVDQYFNAPDRDFAQTDEAVRLRRIGPSNYFTYKGPKRDAHTKTRTEIEIALAPGDETAEKAGQFLQMLHYRPVAHVAKRREVLHLERMGFGVEVCLDEVDQVGRFVELEIMAPQEQLDQGKAALQQLATELGLGPSERRSYLEMLLSATPRRLAGG